MAILIEDASAADLDRLYEIELDCFKDEAFARKHIECLLKDYNTLGLVAKAEGKLVGFIVGAMYTEKGSLCGHILTLDVLSAWRQKGIGKRLMQEMEAMLRGKGVKDCYLEVRENNASALELYRKLGYERVGILEHYYGRNHGIYLVKNLV